MQNLVIENARIMFSNFSGKEGNCNPAGRRNFCVVLDNAIAATLKDDGWNVKILKPLDEMDNPQPFIQVAVNYESRNPPKIVLIKGGRKTLLDQNSVSLLDWANIENADLIISPYRWEISGRTGIKGYLRSMYVTIMQDEFEGKYANIPDSGQNALFEEEI